MGTLNMTFSEASTAASALKANIDEMQTLLTQMNSIIGDNIGDKSVLQGTGADSIINNWQEFNMYFPTFKNSIETQVDNILIAAETRKTANTAVVEQTSGISEM